jgi:hypothetical protein
MADTQIRLIGPNDLGRGLKELDKKVVARTIIKQVQINSVPYLLDAEGALLPTEDWPFGGIDFTFMMTGHTRKFTLADFEFDVPGNTFKLPAGSSVATVESFTSIENYPSFSGVQNNPTHPLGLSASSDANGGHIAFANPASEFPYVKLGMLIHGSIPVSYEPNPLPTPYALGTGFGFVLNDVKFAGDFFTWTITDNGVDVVHGPGPYGNVVTVSDKVFPADTIPWADWANPTQAELDAYQNGSGFFNGVYRPDGDAAPAVYQFPLYFYLMYESNLQPAA